MMMGGSDIADSLGYSAGDFFLDLFFGGAHSLNKMSQGIDPRTGEPMDKSNEPKVHDITKTDAYKALQERLAAVKARGEGAQQRHAAALDAMRAVRSAPSQSYAPIRSSVPSFALGGIPWDMADTALTIMNPAYGLYRLFGGKGVTSGREDEGRATATVQDITKTDAYRAHQARLAQMDAQGQAAEIRRQQALEALRALQEAPASAYTPIAISLPSFALGRSAW